MRFRPLVSGLSRVHERGNQLCFALFAWLARRVLLAGTAKTATGKACNEHKTLVDWDWTVKMLRHICSFLDSGRKK